jgi:hypothetical protein
MLRALTILALLCCLFSSCNKRSQRHESALQEERKQTILKQHAEYEVEQREAKARDLELEAQQLEIKRKFEETETERRLIESAEAEAAAKTLVIKAIEEREAARKAILHKQFTSLTLRDGSRYQDVEIIKVNDLGITVTHRNGARGIDFSQLPYSLQLECKYVPATSK